MFSVKCTSKALQVDCTASWRVYLGICAMDGFGLRVCTVGHPLYASKYVSSNLSDVKTRRASTLSR